MRTLALVVAAAFVSVATGVGVSACDNWPGLGGAGGGFDGGSAQIDDSSGFLGSSCTSTGIACQNGLTCNASFPSGLCTRSCTSSDDCTGGLCIPDPDFMCFSACATSQTCRSGYACSDSGYGLACMPGSAGALAGGANGALTNLGAGGTN